MSTRELDRCPPPPEETAVDPVCDPSPVRGRCVPECGACVLLTERRWRDRPVPERRRGMRQDPREGAP